MGEVQSVLAVNGVYWIQPQCVEITKVTVSQFVQATP